MEIMNMPTRSNQDVFAFEGQISESSCSLFACEGQTSCHFYKPPVYQVPISAPWS